MRAVAVVTPTGSDVGRDLDLVPFRYLVFPVLVHEGILLGHGRVVVDVLVPDDGSENPSPKLP